MSTLTTDQMQDVSQFLFEIEDEFVVPEARLALQEASDAVFPQLLLGIPFEEDPIFQALVIGALLQQTGHPEDAFAVIEREIAIQTVIQALLGQDNV